MQIPTAERAVERMVLDNYSLDDYDFIADERDDLKRIVSDGSLEAVILTAVSDFLYT
jgi:hypothetical protein